MTIATSSYFTDWMAANGVQKDWPYSFAILDRSMVVVQVKNALGVTTEYRENLQLIATNDESGYVRYPVAGPVVAAGNYVRILRDAPYTQEIEIGNEGSFAPELHERAFDLAVIRDQQLKGEVDRAIKVPMGDEEDLPALTAYLMALGAISDDLAALAAIIADIITVAANIGDIQIAADAVATILAAAVEVEANRILAQNAAAAAANSAIEAGQIVSAVTPSVLMFSGDGATVDFDTELPDLEKLMTQVYISGIYQNKEVYEIAVGIITFVEAPPLGDDNIEVIIAGQSVQAFAVPSNGTVSAAKFSPGTSGVSGLALLAASSVSDAQSYLNIIPGFESLAWAEANYHPETAPKFLRVAGYATTNDGGDAFFRWVAAEPGHPGKLSLTLEDASTAWYELVGPQIRPQQCGYFPDDDLVGFLDDLNEAYPEVWLSADWLCSSYPINSDVKISGPGWAYHEGTYSSLGEDYRRGNRDYTRSRVIEHYNLNAHLAVMQQYTVLQSSAAQTIPNGVLTQLTADGFDDAASGRLNSTPSAYRVPPGVRKVEVNGYVTFEANNVGSRHIYLYNQSGVKHTLYNGANPDVAHPTSVMLPGIVVDTADGDLLHLKAYQSSGGDLDSLVWQANFKPIAKEPLTYPGPRLKIYQGNWYTEEAKYPNWWAFVTALAAYDIVAISHIEAFNDAGGVYAQTPNEPLFDVEGAWAVGVPMLAGTNWHNTTAGPNFGKVYECQIDHTPASGTMDDEIATWGTGFWIEVSKVKIQDYGYTKLKKLIRDVRLLNPDILFFGYITAAADAKYWDSGGNPQTQLTHAAAGGYANVSFWIGLWEKDPSIRLHGYFIDHMNETFIDSVVRDNVVNLVRFTGKAIMANTTGISAAAARFIFEGSQFKATDYICFEGFDTDAGVDVTAATNDALVEIGYNKNRFIHVAAVCEEVGSYATHGAVVNGSLNDLNAQALFNSFKRNGWAYSYDRTGYDHIGVPPI